MSAKQNALQQQQHTKKKRKLRRPKITFRGDYDEHNDGTENPIQSFQLNDSLGIEAVVHHKRRSVKERVVVYDEDAPLTKPTYYVHNCSGLPTKRMTAGAGKPTHTYKAILYKNAGDLPTATGATELDLDAAHRVIKTWTVTRRG
jgi:hypothetical protein